MLHPEIHKISGSCGRAIAPPVGGAGPAFIQPARPAGAGRAGARCAVPRPRPARLVGDGSLSRGIRIRLGLLPRRTRATFRLTYLDFSFDPLALVFGAGAFLGDLDFAFAG